ncbi:MAG: sulfotransferase [Rhodoferax sp.]
MTKRYYFMAGLPRSGSTLLSSLLNQNQLIHAGPSSPVFSTMHVVENHFRTDPFFKGFPKVAQGNAIIKNLIEQFYADCDRPIIVDKNRAWPANIRFIEGYIGQRAKVICTVRDISEVIASFIAMIHRHPYKEGDGRLNIIDEQLVRNGILLTDDNRCDFIAGPQGILGQSISAIQEAISLGLSDRLHFVEYKSLMAQPQKTMDAIYAFLGEESFSHDFENIENKYRENDLEIYGLEDMHEVRQKLGTASIDPKKVLSPYVLNRCGTMERWSV